MGAGAAKVEATGGVGVDSDELDDFRGVTFSSKRSSLSEDILRVTIFDSLAFDRLLRPPVAALVEEDIVERRRLEGLDG